MHQVVGTERQADIIQNAVDFIGRHFSANGSLNQVGKLCGVLNACPGLRADVQAELTAIGVGEEVLPEPRREEKGAEAESEKCWNEDLAVSDQTSQQTFLRAPDSGEALLELPLKKYKWITRLPLDRIQLEHVQRKGRDKCSREEVRRKHSENHGLRQRNEQRARHPSQQEQRHEDDANAQRGN